MKTPTTRDTRQEILDVSEEMLRSRSFNSFSYQDISQRVGIRKASIHYHFPSKGDLGLALLERFSDGVRSWAELLKDKDPLEKLDAYFEATLEMVLDDRKICAYGVLGTEFWTLPEAMQEAFKGFQRRRDRWLVQVLREGREQGVFKEIGTPEDQANLIAAAVQGGLQIARSSGDASRLGSIVDQVRKSLVVESPVAVEGSVVSESGPG